jgi:hypothetical protein
MTADQAIDAMTSWITESCLRDTANAPVSDSVFTLFASWRGWCSGQHQPPGSPRAFTAVLNQLGFVTTRDPWGAAGSVVYGLKAKTS